MDEHTLTALKASIQHWRDNSLAKTPKAASVSSDACALCDVFFYEAGEDFGDCVGCPVVARTGQSFCDGSPYHVANIRWRDWVRNPKDHKRGAEFHAAAQAELEFLISLLPEGETP